MAYNFAGNGPESEPIMGYTFKSQPLEPPTGVVVSVVDWHEADVEWRGIHVGPYEEGLLGYKIKYWRTGEEHSAAQIVTLPISDFKYQYHRLTNLIPGEQYNLRVFGYSKGGDGRMSSPLWQFRMVEDFEQLIAAARKEKGKIALFLLATALFNVLRNYKVV